MITDLESAWDQGLRCMNNLYQRYKDDPEKGRFARGLRGAMRNVMGNLTSGAGTPFTIKCEDSPTSFAWSIVNGAHITIDAEAIALTCRSPDGSSNSGTDVPGMALNIANLGRRSTHERRATLFHELLHHIPLFHHGRNSGGYDKVYGLEFCCFGLSNGPLTITPQTRATFPPDNFSCDEALTTSHGQ